MRVHRRFPTNFPLPKALEFVGLHFDDKGYRIYVSEFGSTDGASIELNFGAAPLAQRSMDEGKYLSMSWTADETDGPLGPVVLAVNSDFLDWFHTQSCGIYSIGEVKHVAVLTQNEWIEVLCLRLPDLSYIGENDG